MNTSKIFLLLTILSLKNNVALIKCRAPLLQLSPTLKPLNYPNTTTPLHAIYIDFKAAFDSVQHWTIPQILKHIRINDSIVNLISSLITDSQTSFILQENTTSEILLKIGVKQGDPLSPSLFLIFLLPIQWFLNKTQPKTFTNINHLCYADDMLILAHSRKTLESLFGQLSIYTYYTDMNINTKKTMYTFMNDSPQPPFNIICECSFRVK